MKYFLFAFTLYLALVAMQYAGWARLNGREIEWRRATHNLNVTRGYALE